MTHPRRLLRNALILFALGTVASAVQAQGSPPLALPVLAPGHCWTSGEGAADDRLAGLRRCRQLGAAMVRLRVERSPVEQLPGEEKPAAHRGSGTEPDRSLRACADAGRCLPLQEALAFVASTAADALAPASDAPSSEALLPMSLLLTTPVDLLDAVQSSVNSAGAATVQRVWIEPVLERAPWPAQAVLAPGVSYQRLERLHPRPMVLHVLQIDLARAGVEFVSTPPAEVDADGTEHYPARKTSEFAREQGLIAAVNATYFHPFSPGRLMRLPYRPQTGELTTTSQVKAASEAADVSWISVDSRVDGALCIGPAGFMPTRRRCAAGTRLAVAGGPMLIEAGRRTTLLPKSSPGHPGGDTLPVYYREPAPRTAAAVNLASKTAWLVVVDGRQPGYSDGITLPELAGELLSLGASDAINLDGGGSSTLALDSISGTTVANRPIHTNIPGRERPVANHFGLRLAPH